MADAAGDGGEIYVGVEGRKERLEFYGQTLRDLWEKYIEVTNQMVLLSGGTALLFLQNLPKGWGAQDDARFGVSALFLSGFSMLLSLFWRFISQSLMEYQTLAPESEVDQYYRDAGVQRVRLWFNDPGWRRKWMGFYRWLPILALFSLVGSWISVARFWMR